MLAPIALGDVIFVSRDEALGAAKRYKRYQLLQRVNALWAAVMVLE
jgi:hypothetical protein